jgi:Mn-dependent DtxR family transcriptional regulator
MSASEAIERNGTKMEARDRRRAIWLTLREEGGYWSVHELIDHLREIDPDGAHWTRSVTRALNKLQSDGCVVARPNRYGIETYGVTILCAEPE